MAYDLTPMLDPKHTALLIFECQEGTIGEASHLPTLAAAVSAGNVVPNIASLLDGARKAGARVFYCKIDKRNDGVGDPGNTPLLMRLRRQSKETSVALGMGEIIAALAPREGDVVVAREHGLTGFYESGLDAYLRNTGIKTVVITGVSVNIGVIGTTIEAVNRGYTAVVPTDCVAGDPPEYAEQALRYSVRNIAFMSTSGEIANIWSKAS